MQNNIKYKSILSMVNKIYIQKILILFFLVLPTLAISQSLSGPSEVSSTNPVRYELLNWDAGCYLSCEFIFIDWVVTGGTETSSGSYGTGRPWVEISWEQSASTHKVECRYQYGWFDYGPMDYIWVTTSIPKYVTYLDLQPPPTPGAITGSSTVSEDQTVTYSISAVSEATSYDWVIPSEMSFISGSHGTSIQVQANNALSSGLVKVRAVNAQGNSDFQTKSISISPITVSYSSQTLPGSYQISLESTMSSKNYVHIMTPLTPFSENALSNSGTRDASALNEQVHYFDGLGRLIQTLDVKVSPSGKDIVIPIEYDGFGRKEKDYLPCPLTNNPAGEYVNNNNITSTTGYLDDFYDGTNGIPDADGYYYTQQEIENSPINRVLKQASPGNSWSISSTNYIEYSYGSNVSGDIRLWTMSGSTATTTGCYDANELYVKGVSDENGNPVKEYVDKLGRTVVKEVNDSEDYRTYYVYDDFGRLRYVFPPLMSKNLGTSGTVQYTPSSTTVTKLAYYYEYDSKGRMIIKQLPGAGQTYMIYDHRDRLVATQNEEERNSNTWYVYKYDALNRLVIEGTLTSSLTLSSMQSTVDNYSYTADYEKLTSSNVNVSPMYGYSNYSFPTGISPWKFYYYDGNYFSGDYTYSSNTVVGSDDKSNMVGSLMTATRTKVLNPDVGMSSILLSVIYYDKYGRIIQTVSDNHLSGFDIVSNKYKNTVTELVETSLQEHGINGASDDHSVTYDYEYDHTGRLLEAHHSIDGSTDIILSAQRYNALGQLKEKYLHANPSSNQALQKIDYKYNIRGWLSSINDVSLANEGDVFGMELLYDSYIQGVGSAGDEQYNGNISGIKWNSEYQGAQVSNDLKAYAYRYDALNRLEGALFAQGASLDDIGDYSVNNIGYDENGNITGLKRYVDGILRDDLVMTYDGNKLKTTTDNSGQFWGFNDGVTQSTEYIFDENGNLLGDANGSLDYPTTYQSHLNLMLIADGNSGFFSNYYSANGMKLRKNANNVDDVDYIGNFVYKNGTLDYILTSEGRIVYNCGSFSYQYFMKDHLGNTRVVVDENKYILQANDYYPFGMRHEPVAKEDGTQKYLFNGKEFQEEVGFLDYGARMYDPSLGRWHSTDPLNQFYSGYVYCGNNPINMIDPTGMWSYDDDGNYTSTHDEWMNQMGFSDNPWGNSDVGDGVNYKNIYEDGKYMGYYHWNTDDIDKNGWLEFTFNMIPTEEFKLGSSGIGLRKIVNFSVATNGLAGTYMINGEKYLFGDGSTELGRRGLKEIGIPDNSVQNYQYYINNKEKFRDAIFSDIFVSEKARWERIGEMMLYEAVETLTWGAFDSGNAIKFTTQRRSKYANLFPLNITEFTPTIQQRREYNLYQLEKGLSPLYRSPEFQYWDKKYNNTDLLF